MATPTNLGMSDLSKLGDGFGVGTYGQDMERIRKEHKIGEGDGRVYVVKDVMGQYISVDCPKGGFMAMALVLKGAKRFYDAQEAWGWATRSIYPALPIVLDDETAALIQAAEAKDKADRDKPTEIWMQSVEVAVPPGLDPEDYMVTISVERRDEEPLTPRNQDDIASALAGVRLTFEPEKHALSPEEPTPWLNPEEHALLSWRDNLTDAWGEELEALLLNFIIADEPDSRMSPRQLAVWQAFRRQPEGALTRLIAQYLAPTK